VDILTVYRITATYGIDSDAKVLSIDALDHNKASSDVEGGDDESDSYSDYGFHLRRRRKRRIGRISDSPTSNPSTGSFLGIVEYLFPMNYNEISSSEHFIPSLSYILRYLLEKEANGSATGLNDCINKKDMFQYLLECESGKV
jgi:hypothetical protein